MLSCGDMKKGDIFTCQECGLELQVVKECTDVEATGEQRACRPEAGPCTFSCCGKELVKKT